MLNPLIFLLEAFMRLQQSDQTMVATFFSQRQHGKNGVNKNVA